MRDEETESLWDHITGECFEGPLEGRRLDLWPVFITNVAAELERDPDAVLLQSDFRSIKSTLMKAGAGIVMDVHKPGTMIAPHFRASMSDEIDPRLPEGEQGLGVMTDEFAGKFYPMRAVIDGPIIDTWQGRELRITRGQIDGIPQATFVDTGEMPMQLLTRWYGFAFTCPRCDIYAA